MIVLYKKWIFKGNDSSHLSKMLYTYIDKPKINWIGNWAEDDKSFIKHYHKLYPNESKRIFCDKRRPISKLMRANIEKFMKTDPEFIMKNRDEKLLELLS